MCDLDTPTRSASVLLLEPELLEQLTERLGELDRAEVFTVDVLDQRFAQEIGIPGVAKHHRDGGEASDLGGAQASFAGDQFVALTRTCAPRWVGGSPPLGSMRRAT